MSARNIARACAMSLSQALQAQHIRASREEELQDGVEHVLRTFRSGLEYQRETHLGRADRPDFLVMSPGPAIECKIDGSAVEVLRQLSRYAAHADVSALLLVTTRNKHLQLPDEIHGKPIVVCVVNGGGLL